jgi:hypothetical protein
MAHATSEVRTIGEELAELTRPRGTPARALLGVLPLRRVIPQDLHSLGDYGDSLRVMVAGLLTHDRDARAASLALGVSGVMVSSLTDYRLSVLKLIPIEAHEVIDHLWGAAVIAAPFVLGYRKRAPVTAALHVLVGAAHLAAALFTDYRSARAVPERIGTAALPTAA